MRTFRGVRVRISEYMTCFILTLLILVQLPWSSLCGSVPTLSTVCGFDHVAYSKSTDGNYLSINRQMMEDPLFICEVPESYFKSGCLLCDSEVESWRRIGEEFCNQDLTVPVDVNCNPISVDLLRKAGRKSLLQSSANASKLDLSSSKSQSLEKELDLKNSSASDNVSLAAPGMFLLCCAFMCPCLRAKRREATEHNVLDRHLNSMDSISSVEVGSASERIPATPLKIPPSPSRFSLSPQLTRIGSVHLSIHEITKATRNFSPSLKLGEGGFGAVYKAVLPDGQVVAIKRAKKEEIPALRDEFSNEVELLAKIEHRNLVRLLGYTDKGNERIIITEYVPNGTLREHLDGQHGKILDVNQRLEIAIDVAHALTYLHLYAEKTIIHRDVKSSNILLTESYRAKVSDFGFARSGSTDREQTHISTKVIGTAGYLDPEYLRTNQLTPKSDVFSFGILLIEIFSGRRPVQPRREKDERITVRWAFKKYNEGNLRDIVDPLLDEVIDEQVLEKILSLAFQCSAPTRADRPDMKEVVEKLWEIRKEFGKSLRRV